MAESQDFRGTRGQGHQNSAELVAKNVWNDESDTVGNDVKFEKPQAKAGFLTELTRKVEGKSALKKAVLHPTTCLVDTKEASTVINLNYLKNQWKCRVMRIESMKLRTARKEVIDILWYIHTRTIGRATGSNLVRDRPELGSEYVP